MTTQEIEFTNLSSGETFKCNGFKDANRVIGRSTFYIRKKILYGQDVVGVDGNSYRAKVLNNVSYRHDGKNGNLIRSQLCWKCKKSCGGCSWSRNFVPIDGWEAEESVIHNAANKVVVTYSVISCPDFDEE